MEGELFWHWFGISDSGKKRSENGGLRLTDLRENVENGPHHEYCDGGVGSFEDIFRIVVRLRTG